MTLREGDDFLYLKELSDYLKIMQDLYSQLSTAAFEKIIYKNFGKFLGDHLYYRP